MIVMCPKGCGHPIEWHTATRVSFSDDRKDYDAISCLQLTCRCRVPADQWEGLLVDMMKQRRLFQMGDGA